MTDIDYDKRRGNPPRRYGVVVFYRNDYHPDRNCDVLYDGFSLDGVDLGIERYAYAPVPD